MYIRPFYKILTIMSLIPSSDFSRVIDSSVTKGLFVTDYCPFMKGCAKPGIHVMCLKNPNVINWFGPHCHEAKNITVTDQIALRLLTIVNAIRRKVALGIEKGKDGRYFPRGYGIWKLEWDSELATFAQVWANQCVFHRDYCRSTDRFPNPSQSLGLVRFTYPDWKPITTSWPGTGFQPQIIVHAVIQTVKKWYTLKNSIGVDQIDSLAQSGVSKPYLNMVSSDVTHMGCGISAFTEYSYNSQDVDLLFNSVLLVCNFSGHLVAGTPVYNTTPPTSPEFTKCGCPPGSKEDDDCLCSISDNKTCTGPQCKPTVVLLPIFTVEDAPPGKMPKRFLNVTRDKESMEVHKLFQNLGFNNSKEYNKTPRFYQEPRELHPRIRQETTTKENNLNSNFVRRNAFNKTKPSNSCSNPKSDMKYDIKNPTKQADGVNIGIRRKVLDKKSDNTKKPVNITAHRDTPDKISLLQTRNESIDTKIADLLEKLDRAVSNVQLDGHNKQLLDERIKKIYGDILQKSPNSADRDRYSNLKREYEKNIINRINGNPYHDMSYLENYEVESQQNDGVNKNILSNTKENVIPFDTETKKYILNTYIDSHPVKRPVIGAKGKRKNVNFVVKNRVVKDGALDVDRRMYYQAKLNYLGKSLHRDQAQKSSRYSEISGVGRRRPTIN